MPLQSRSKLKLATYAVTVGALAPTGVLADMISVLAHSTTDSRLPGFDGEGGPIFMSSTTYSSDSVVLPVDLSNRDAYYYLDIDDDGIDDFQIQNYWSGDGSMGDFTIWGHSASAAVFVDYGGGVPYAVPLDPGTEIGPGLVDPPSIDFFDQGLVFESSIAPATLFTLNQPAFVGLVFDAGNDGKLNYGWLLVELTANSPVQSGAIISGAYNPTNGGSITTPSVSLPGTLALLAAGAAGLGAVRRRREDAAQV